MTKKQNIPQRFCVEQVIREELESLYYRESGSEKCLIDDQKNLNIPQRLCVVKVEVKNASIWIMTASEKAQLFIEIFHLLCVMYLWLIDDENTKFPQRIYF